MKTFLLLAVVAAVATVGVAQEQRAPDRLLAQVDHLVYATPDLQLGVDTIEKMLGVRATPGGQHPGMGTRNALVALGASSYLEIIGPDPEQPKPKGSRRFGIDDLKSPRLVAWVAKGTDLEALAGKAAQNGVRLGTVIAGSRKRPDGAVLSWRYTDPSTVIADGLVPYFIDWGSSAHPSTSSPRGAALAQLRAEHPDAAQVQAMLDRLGLDLRVRQGPKPALVATIDSSRGRVELR